MDDPLERFRDPDERLDDEASVGREHALLLFAYAGTTYAVSAERVDAVITWHKPAPLPASSAAFAGVVQDRGRIVAVLSSPLGRASREDGVARRIVICATSHGFVGLPCEETRQVGAVTLPHDVTPGEMVDSSSGPLVYLDPESLIRQLRGTSGDPNGSR